MKRRRKSTSIEPKSKILGEENNGRVSISDLPIEILMDIQSRLSVKNIFICRSVCKLWLQILLSDVFAKLHFSLAPICPMLRNPDAKTIDRALYLLELERDILCYICDSENNVDKSLCARNCTYHDYEGHVNMKISTGLALPKLNGGVTTVVNSCNGLLCLRRGFADLIVICNPITSEFVFLPPFQNGKKSLYNVTYGGLGFCTVSDEYKVLVMVYERKDHEDFLDLNMTLVFSLKSGTWKRVGTAPPILRRVSDPACLNGSLHWLVGDWPTNNLIFYFDFVDDQFLTMLPPRHMRCHPNPYDRDHVLKGLKSNLNWRIGDHFICDQMRYTSLGVLGGNIFLCDSSSLKHMEVWVMNDYGVGYSWVKMFHLDECSIDNVYFPMRYSKPIDYLKNGDLLMYQVDNAFISHDGDDSRYFKICRFRSMFQVIPHKPSFISLKEIVGDDMEVRSVRSSELQKQKVRPLLLREDDPLNCLRTFEIEDGDYYSDNND